MSFMPFTILKARLQGNKNMRKVNYCSYQIGGFCPLSETLPRIFKYLPIDEDDDCEGDEEGPHGGVDDVTVLFGQLARGIGSPIVGPIVPSDQGRKTYKAAEINVCISQSIETFFDNI